MSLFSRLLGDERSFPLEHRLSNGLMLVVAAITLATVLYNALAEILHIAEPGVATTANYVLAITGFVFLGLYLWSRRGRVFERPAWLSLFLFVLVFYPAIWIGNYGVDGNIAVISLGGVVAAASLFSGWRRNLMFVVTAATTAGLFLVDYHELVEIDQYKTRFGRYLDTFATLTQVAIGIAAAVIGMRTSYQRERDKTNEYAKLVEQTNHKLESALVQNQLLARTDELTRLPNRRYFQELLVQRIGEATRYQRILSLAIIDVDHFKSINDTHGHAIGDQILSELGSLLNNQLRDADVCARWGGEEFVLLCPETSLAGIHVVAERLRTRVQRQVFPNAVPVTISIGLATWQAGDTEQSLFERADRALYSAKHSGRNRVVDVETLTEPAAVAETKTSRGGPL